MNYLAHARLSFEQPAVVVGNMISDHVKGKKQFDFPLAVQKGIRLHREIDGFTDSHPATEQIKSFFKPHYRLYAGAFADVVYDHFLANDRGEFENDDALQQFSLSTYNILDDYFDLLPPGFQTLLPYMKQYDWLYNYKTREGIEKSFAGLVRRSKYLTESAVAFTIFNKHYDTMNLLYRDFYPDVKIFAAHQLQRLLNT